MSGWARTGRVGCRSRGDRRAPKQRNGRWRKMMPASWGLRNAFVFVDTPGPHDPAQDSIGRTREKSHSGSDRDCEPSHEPSSCGGKDECRRLVYPDQRQIRSEMHFGGGWGIRTPEGFHPTRFPSVRHRPLGESSVGAGMRTRGRPHEMLPDFGSRSVHGRADASCCDIRSVSHRAVEQVEWKTAPRVAPSRPIPPGRKRSKGNRALAGARGVFFMPPHRRCAVLRYSGLPLPAAQPIGFED